jgi:hypothetical protein
VAVAVVGRVGDKDHDKLVTDLLEQFDYHDKQLAPMKSAMSRYHRLYLGERKDTRRENEKWRSNSWLGDPFHQTETEVAVWLSILNSQTPTVSAEGIGKEDEWKARAFTRAIEYFQRANRWTYQQEQILRKVSFQGWTVIETRWREIKYDVVQPPTKEQRIQYDESVKSAMMQGMPEPPDAVNDPQRFAMWNEQARLTPPAWGPREVIQYRGPWWANSSDYDYYFDPFTEDWSELPVLVKRMYKPWKWLVQNAGPEPEKPFDEENLQASKGHSGTTDNRLLQWDREIATRQGLSIDEQDPIYRDGAELLAFWRIGDKLPYSVVCNRKGVINKRPDQHPFFHRQLPYTPIRNIPWHGRAIGQSSYAQLEKMFADRLRFRDLLLDMMLISVMPVLLKRRGMGLPDLQKAWQPGMILDTNDPQGLQKAFEAAPGFGQLVEVTQLILNDQNVMLGTGENVRGQQATVGRVSATEAQSRLTQALVRHTQRAVRLEEEFNPIIPQALALVAQKWPSDDPNLSMLRAKMVGDDERDPWAEAPAGALTKDTFIEALNMDLRFTGASRSRDLNLQAQQMKDFLQFGASIQVAPGVPALLGTEVRAGLRRIYQTLGQKGLDDIVSPQGDQAVMAAVDLSLRSAMSGMQLQTTQTEQQIQMAQQPPEQPPAPGPEATIVYRDTPPDVKRQLEERAGLQPSQMGALEVQQAIMKAMPRPAPAPQKGNGPPRG